MKLHKKVLMAVMLSLGLGGVALADGKTDQSGFDQLLEKSVAAHPDEVKKFTLTQPEKLATELQRLPGDSKAALVAVIPRGATGSVVPAFTLGGGLPLQAYEQRLQAIRVLLEQEQEEEALKDDATLYYYPDGSQFKSLVRASTGSCNPPSACSLVREYKWGTGGWVPERGHARRVNR